MRLRLPWLKWVMPGLIMWAMPDLVLGQRVIDVWRLRVVAHVWGLLPVMSLLLPVLARCLWVLGQVRKLLRLVLAVNWLLCERVLCLLVLWRNWAFFFIVRLFRPELLLNLVLKPLVSFLEELFLLYLVLKLLHFVC